MDESLYPSWNDENNYQPMPLDQLISISKNGESTYSAPELKLTIFTEQIYLLWMILKYVTGVYSKHDFGNINVYCQCLVR